MVALDRVLTKVLGFSPDDVPILGRARARGLEGASLESIKVLGSPTESLLVKDWSPAGPMDTEAIVVPGFLVRPLREQLVPRPVFDHARCTRCGTCIEHCAPHAIKLRPRGRQDPGPRNNRLAISLDLGACIRCFCCQEVCPEGAVGVGEGTLLRLLRASRLLGRRRAR